MALDEQELDELVAFANSLVDAAREVVLPYWRLGIEVDSKDEPERPEGESPVTAADRQAEQAMRDLIASRYDKHGIYGEEHGVIRADADWVWVLDPIDGTKSFITGKPLFGTLVACLYHGVPVIGIIDQCVLGERWVGVCGRKTTLNGAPVSTRCCAALCDAMMYATTPHMFAAGHEAGRFAAMCAAVKRPLFGADCYAYALVASGFGADLVVEADLGLYDYCALVPVVEGAGGKMTDWAGQTLSLRNHQLSRGRVVAAGSSDLHAQALKVLSRSEGTRAAHRRRGGRRCRHFGRRGSAALQNSLQVSLAMIYKAVTMSTNLGCECNRFKPPPLPSTHAHPASLPFGSLANPCATRQAPQTFRTRALHWRQ